MRRVTAPPLNHTPASPLGFKNPRVQRLRRLVRRRSEREAERAFVVEGNKFVDEAIDSGATLECVFVASGSRCTTIRRAQTLGIAVHELEDGVIERVADTVTPQSVMAVVSFLDADFGVLDSIDSIIVLAGVTDPGNAGTVVRSVEAAGLGGVVVCKGSVDVYNPKTVRSTAGALFHVPVIMGDDAENVRSRLVERGFRCVATTARGGTPYDRADLGAGAAIFLGNEANGLDEALLPRLDESVSIPIHGHSDSLNVSMAASVLCFEAARQRRP